MNYSMMFETMVSLLTLFFLEVVLGIDNLVFVAISCSRLPKAEQARARNYGLLMALVTRLLLLASVSWLASFTNPLMVINNFQISGRDLLLGIGGVFLLYKGTQEIHNEFDNVNIEDSKQRAPTKFKWVIVQVAILDIIFSFDSVLTAVGMTKHYWIMATAITMAMVVMIFASHPLSSFIEKNPSVKMLATSFIIMIGMVLIAEGMHYPIPHGYLYFSISFSLGVESLNIILRNKKKLKT